MSLPDPQATFEARRHWAHIALREGRAATAEAWLRGLEAEYPRDVNCRWLLGVALLDQGKLTESLTTLENLLTGAPDFIDARVDLARAYRSGGRATEARAQLRQVLEKMPHHHRAWLAYGDVLVDLERYDDARIAFERAGLTDPYRARIDQAAALLTSDHKKSEGIFREILQADPSHTAALAGLATVSRIADKNHDAVRLLRHALKQSAHLPLVWRELTPALQSLGHLEEAEAAARYLVKIEPESPQSWITTAAVATRLMRQEEALKAYEHAARLKPAEVGLRLSIGHVCKTLGRRTDSEAAYKAALTMDPGYAEAYCSLAELKNYTFSDMEVTAMQGLLRSDPREYKNQAQLHFALGKAFEQRRTYTEAFIHYAQGNALRRRDGLFDIENFERRSARICAFFDAEFFAARRDCGDPSCAPIFIVGLPRSGSTLIEQILASHSRVEGTMELPNIINLVYELDDQVASRDGYPDTLGAVSATQLAALGSRYLKETTPLRAGREHFTDKLPNNFSHVGFIHSILPNAVVIDARRHPMDACFSCFKQYFAEGQTFSYDLHNLGRYYRCYLELMDHWDSILPGKVLQVQYEELVSEPEKHIRRLVAHCGLEFEPGCLNFHETRRSVRTASAEQVRQPLYTSGVGYWKHFAGELEPLRVALGDCLGRFGPMD